MNLGQLRTSLQTRGYDTDTATQQNELLNSQYRDVCATLKWPFMEKQDTSLATTQGVVSVSLASIADLVTVDAVRLVQGTDYFNLQALPTQDLRNLEHVDRQTGRPHYWTQHAGLIRFYPIPDGVYQITLDYIFDPPDLGTIAGDLDTPLFGATFHDVLVWGAVEELAFRHRDWISQEFAGQKRELLFKRMEQNYLGKQRQSASHVRKHRKGWDVV